jgi:shikimate kinase
MQPVFLVGFMGSGKTTFGKKLAAKLKVPFVDLDLAVVDKYNADNPASTIATLKQLIEEKGMPFFRAIESETLRLMNTEAKVVSTGGGAPIYFDNMEWMKRRGCVVFLDVEEGILFSRLKTTDLEERPLLKDLDDAALKQFIHEKLQERLPVYSQAHIRFNPINQKTEELVLQLGQ